VPAKKKTPRRLTASQEDYLEAILALIHEGGSARVRDLAKRLSVAMPSVTGALKTLAKRELVHYEPYQLVTLTARGAEMADRIRRRHQVLRRLLEEVLEIDEATAETAACRMEHAVEGVVLERLESLVEFFASGAAGAATAAFRKYCRRSARSHASGDKA